MWKCNKCNATAEAKPGTYHATCGGGKWMEVASSGTASAEDPGAGVKRNFLRNLVGANGGDAGAKADGEPRAAGGNPEWGEAKAETLKLGQELIDADSMDADEFN